MADSATTGDALDRAKALASPVRARIHEIVAAAEAPVTVAHLVEATGLHRRAVGLHLRQLAQAGLVREFTLPPTGRGRPRLAYRAVDPQPYRTMSAWLTSGLTRSAAVELGRAAGRSLSAAGIDGVERIVAEAAQRGFRPTVEPGEGDRLELVLHHCPYADLARTDPAVVCGLHRGVLDGIAEAAGDVVVERLEIADPVTAGCRLRVRRITH